jgi:hypothetical protein
MDRSDLARALRRLRVGPLAQELAKADVAACADCGARLMSVVDWYRSDSQRWWLLLRCGGCGGWREASATDGDVKRYSDELEQGRAAVEAAVESFDPHAVDFAAVTRRPGDDPRRWRS